MRTFEVWIASDGLNWQQRLKDVVIHASSPGEALDELSRMYRQSEVSLPEGFNSFGVSDRPGETPSWGIDPEEMMTRMPVGLSRAEGELEINLVITNSEEVHHSQLIGMKALPRIGETLEFEMEEGVLTAKVSEVLWFFEAPYGDAKDSPKDAKLIRVRVFAERQDPAQNEDE